MQPRREADMFSDALSAYSTLFGLGHTDAHLAELLPHIVNALNGLTRLRAIDVAAVDMAVTFVAEGV